MWNSPLVDMAGLPYVGLKKKGTPMYGSPSSNIARAAASLNVRRYPSHFVLGERSNLQISSAVQASTTTLKSNSDIMLMLPSFVAGCSL
jgi:hypothetical protein